MLHRLLDPATSTRRTPSARARLAEHPMTTALLDAGLRLLLAEFAAPTQRLFDALTGARVCAAATALGPLRTTEGHLRDRWPRHDDFVTDLLAYGLWELHWSTVLRSVGQVRPPTAGRPTPDHLTAIAAHLADLHLYAGRDAVTHRLELLTAALAAARPDVRAARARSYAHLDAVYGSLYQRLFRWVGFRPRPDADLDGLVVVFGALTEGANLRLVPRGDEPAARTAAARTIAVAGELLARTAWEVDPAPPLVPPPLVAPEHASEPLRPELADVLTRLTDPRTGTRRTQEGRRRLAADPLTRQLLDGGVAVLAEEFALTPGGGSRAFDALSVARVVAEARSGPGAGQEATAAQLRDRWAVQEHYVDDLVSHALRRRTSVVDALAAGGAALTPMSAERATAVMAEHLLAVRSGTAARLRLLVTTLAGARPGMARALVRLDDAEREALAALLATQLELGRRELLPGVDLEELCGWVLALADGLEVRLLATGEEDVDGAARLLLTTAAALVEACCRPR